MWHIDVVWPVVLEKEVVKMGDSDGFDSNQLPYSSRDVLLGGEDAEIYEICIGLRGL